MRAVVVAVLLVAAAVALAPLRRSWRHAPGQSWLTAPGRSRRLPPAPGRPRRLRLVAARVRPLIGPFALGLMVALAIGGWAGLLAGPLTGAGLHRWWSRRPSKAQVASERRVAADLPYAADLLAAVLRAGAPPDVAAGTVGAAIAGPLGERLVRVARALRLGTPAAQAWGHLGADDGAARLAQAAGRTEHSGAAFAGALMRVAEDLRAARLAAVDSAARRAGVLIVLPLGLCFLPAFVLAGLLPVIVAVLGDVLTP